MSPVIATTIILAITITLGLGIWSFATSGVSVATDTYAKAVTDYGNFASDRFVIANIAFDNPADGNIAFWIYNSGKLPTTVNSVVITCKDCSDILSDPIDLTQVSPADPAEPMTVLSKDLKKFTFDLTSPNKLNGDADFGNRTFELTVISETGATQSFIKRSD